MRNFTLAIAAVTMLGLGAAHAEQATMKGHQPGARAHLQPTGHRILAEGDGSGADIRSNPNVHHSTLRSS